MLEHMCISACMYVWPVYLRVYFFAQIVHKYYFNNQIHRNHARFHPQIHSYFFLDQDLSFQAGQLKLNKSPATITLISRRCTRRLGTRMWRRGANLEGDAANFIETEQLLEYQGFKSSFLQVRGSIPLLWEQIVDLSYKPRVNIIDHEQTPKVVERHFHDLLQRYGEIVALDLTDQHGDEGVINMAFAAEMRKLRDARYVSFDFHQHCGNSNFDNLQLLHDQIAEDFEKQG